MRKIFVLVALVVACAKGEKSPTEPEKGVSELPTKALEVSTSLEKVHTAHDSASIVAAYALHLKLLEAMYVETPLEALTLAQAGYKKAFENASQEELERSDKILSGLTFGEADFVAGSQVAATTAALKGVTILFVNGVFTSRDALALGRKELEILTKAAGLFEFTNVYGFYNGSSWYDTDVKNRCLRSALEFAGYEGLTSCGWIFAGDLLESKRQIATLINNLPPQSKESKALLARIILERTLGRKVILVGHSQGTLIIGEAMRLYGKLDRCVSVVDLAAPLSIKSSSVGVSPGNLYGLVVAGEKARDILLALGYNDYPRVATNVSRESDKKVSDLDNPNLALALAAGGKILEDMHLHLFLESYMAGEESRADLLAILKTEVGRLKPETCTPNTGEEARTP